MADTRINPADIPAEIESELRKRFEEDPKVRMLRRWTFYFPLQLPVAITIGFREDNHT